MVCHGTWVFFEQGVSLAYLLLVYYLITYLFSLMLFCYLAFLFIIDHMLRMKKF